MKNLLTSVLTVSLLLVSCNDLLDTKPQGAVTTENFWLTEQDASTAVIAVYDVLQWDNTTGINRWVFGDLVSDDAEKGGESPADWAEMQQLADFTANAGNPLVATSWENLYVGIYRANLVISNVPGIDMDTDLRDRYIAEAKFLRAWYYFNLVKLFGGVPLVTRPLEPSEYIQPRASAEEVYSQIEKDLTEAAEVLPRQYPATDLGRATWGSAKALLVKAYVFQSKWQQAEPLAKEIIDSGVYSLEPDYAYMFTLEGEHGTGSVFEIDFATIPGIGSWGDATEGTIGDVYRGSRGNWGWGFDCPTQDLVDEFEPGDPRLDATVINDGEELPDGQIADNRDSPTSMHNQKAWIPESARPGNNDGNDSMGPKNVIDIRYAEILLWHAEAANENGNTAAALQSLNEVRERARGGNPTILPDVTTTNKDELRQAIWHERRVELGMEAHRFFDLVRQGRAVDILGPRGFKEGTHEVFPIPQEQIELSQGKLEQNNGY